MEQMTWNSKIHLFTSILEAWQPLANTMLNLVGLRQSKEAKGLSMAGFFSWLIWRSAYLTRVFKLEEQILCGNQLAYTTLVFDRKQSWHVSLGYVEQSANEYVDCLHGILNKLKVLNLSNSKDLTRAPDFSQVPQLEILILEGCTCLVKVHESIGCLKKLVLLNFKNCMNLKDLPRSIFNLVSLESVDLSGCSALEKLPEVGENIMDLTKLIRDETPIYQLPSSFGVLKNLKYLSLEGCSRLTELPNFLQAPHLERLGLKGCMGLVEIHESIGYLRRLVSLSLNNCMNLKDLPRSIFNLESLESFDLSGCSALEKLPEGNMMDLTKLIRDETPIYQQPSSFGVLKNLKYLSLDGCSRLIELPNFLQAPHLEILGLQGCMGLVEIHESIGYLRRLVSLNLNNCMNLKDLPRSIFNLESLESFDLSGCSALEKLPEGNMMDLTKLIRDETPIYQLPSSFGVLKNLKYLSFDGCSSLTELPNFLQAPHLERLGLKGCMGLVEIHESIGYLRRLHLTSYQSNWEL
ncbi:disease resistance protein RPV1-like [Corylus avellana]|uniref:disease resistance protein RPV1-like n=1 Tax=Corylus avellana TaxID=13451 RepID=UPI00286B2F27|nr:disease resistance protein RPV1-like [Corylus avellana]